jgi:hypothetical protein
LLLPLRNESTVPPRRSPYLPSVPGCPTLAAHLAAATLPSTRLAERAPRRHRSVRPLRHQKSVSPAVRPAPSTGSLFDLAAAAISAQTLGSRSARKISRKARKKSAAPPNTPALFYLAVATLSSTNTTLAGVAQSVERVALTTAKRSTSRSWVRAPPSAIPI